MLRQTLNEFEVVLHLEARSGLLSAHRPDETTGELPEYTDFAATFDASERKLADRKAATEQAQKMTGEPDLTFVTTNRNGQKVFYLPGSSIKGVLRSHAESQARAWSGSDQVVCDPFSDKSCSRRLSKKQSELDDQNLPMSSAQIYHEACPICKLFGCLQLGSRLRISDAQWIDPKRAEHYRIHDHVGIDRRSGAAHAGAKYTQKILERGSFTTTLIVQNFELWQIGLLAYLFDDLIHERIRIGYGTRRGLGRVKATLKEITMRYYGDAARQVQHSPAQIAGIGSLTASQRLPDYGDYHLDAPAHAIEIAGAAFVLNGLAAECRLKTDAQQELLWAGTALLWDDYLARQGGQR